MTSIKFHFIGLLFFLLCLCLPQIAQAAVGCCQIIYDRDHDKSTYEHLDETTCTDKNSPIPGNVVPHSFEVGKIPNGDKSGCIEDLGESLPKNSNPLDNPKLAVSIPNLNLKPITCDETSCSVSWMADYINALYKYGLGIIGILAVIAIMIGGILWVTAAGNDERIGDAKKWISGSIMGVIIALTAYTILNIINPALTKLSPIKLASVNRTELEQTLPPEALTEEYTSSSLPRTNLGTGAGKYKVPILYQGRFKSEYASFGPCGCGPTSLTMVLNYHGINKSAKEVGMDAKKDKSWDQDDPPNCGWRAGMEGFKAQFSKYGLKSKSVGSGDFKNALDLLQYGPVIASLTSKGCQCVYPMGKAHYIVITGYENGIVYVNDPNESNHTRYYTKRKTTVDTAKLDLNLINECCVLNMGAIASYK